jgi:hypothetical protein
VFAWKSVKRFKNPQHQEVVKMNEELASFQRALETFRKIFWREPTLDGFETIQYIARSTQGCPPGLEKALKEVVYKWAAKAYTEFAAVDERPVFKQ